MTSVRSILARTPRALAVSALLLLAAAPVRASYLPPLAAPGASLDTRSDPTPRYFWDANNDGTPDDSSATVDAEGGSWNAAKGNLLTDATNEWDTTDFDPTRVTGGMTGTHDVYIDGTTPSCGSFTDALAATCRVTEVHYYAQDPTVVHYYRMLDADTYFNTGQFTFSFSTGGPPVGTYDFQGIATHELGHWARLVDVYDSTACIHNNQRDTMCGVFYSNTDSFYARSLSPDDIASANAVYP